MTYSNADIYKMLNALSGQESAGDYTIDNRSGSKAHGKYQIMPASWGEWAGEILGDSNAPQTPENQERVAFGKVKEYAETYGIEEVPYIWYSGNPSTAYTDATLDKPQEWNGDKYPSIRQYANEVLERFNGAGDTTGGVEAEGFNPFSLFEDYNDINYVPENPVGNYIAQKPTFTDKFEDAVFNSAFIGGLRTQRQLAGLADERGFRLTQEQIDDIQKRVGDYDATYWIVSNARSMAQVEALVTMKQEDLRRQERIANEGLFDISWSTAGTLLGNALDPLNYIPIVGAGAKINTLAKFGKVFAKGAAFTLAERGATQALTGYSQNYVEAAMLGGLMQAGVPLLANKYKEWRGGSKLATDTADDIKLLPAPGTPKMLPAGKNTPLLPAGGKAGGALAVVKGAVEKPLKVVEGEVLSGEIVPVQKATRNLNSPIIDTTAEVLSTPKVIDKVTYRLLDMGMSAQDLVNGKRPPFVKTIATEFLDALHAAHTDVLSKTIKNKKLKAMLDPKKNIFVVSKKDAARIVSDRGGKWTDNIKGFYDDETGAIGLVADNLKSEADVLKTIWHEAGSHGLRMLLPEVEYAKLMNELTQKMIKPSPALRRAMERARLAGNEGELDEILGYLAEEVKPSNPLMHSLHKMVNKAFNLLGMKGKLSDEDFLDLMKEATRKRTRGGYVHTPDGGVIYKGLHFSKDNILNPEAIDRAGRLFGAKESVVNAMKDKTEWLFKRAGYFGTVYSVGETSKSMKLSSIIDRLVNNPFMNKPLEKRTIENIKTQLRSEGDGILNDFLKKRTVLMSKLQMFSAQNYTDVNEMLVRAYDAKYAGAKGFKTKDIPQEVWDCVNILHEQRNWVKELTEHPERYGGNDLEALCKTGWLPYDNAFYRQVDPLKYRDALNMRFGGDQKKMYEWLVDYAKATADRGALKRQLDAKKLRAYKEKLAEWNKTKQGEKPQKPQLTEKDYLADFEKRCEAWARGITDEGAYKNVGNNLTTLEYNISNLTFLRERLPMDTSLKRNLGEAEVSFDDLLRSYDLDTYLPMMQNRLCGEVALTAEFKRGQQFTFHTPLGDKRTVDYTPDNLREVIKAELDTAVAQGKTTRQDAQKDLKAFNIAIARLRGVPLDGELSMSDMLADSLNSFAYVRNSGNMVFNQMGEVSGLLAQGHFSAVLEMFPVIGEWIQKMHYGKDADKYALEALRVLNAQQTERFMFGNANNFTSRRYQNFLGDTATARTLDKANGMIRAASQFASYTTGFAQTEGQMLRLSRYYAFNDLTKWVAGKDMGLFNPFTTKRLRVAGLNTKEAIAQFRQDLASYLHKNKQGEVLGINVKKLRAENPELYGKVFDFIESRSNWAMVQASIGNENIMKTGSAGWKLLFMFKNFVMMAVQSQAMRAYYNRTWDDALSATLSMATNASVVYGLAYARSKYSVNKDNPAAHQRYMDEQYKNLWYTAIMRSTMLGAPLSPVNDVLEATGNAPVASIRTTTNRYVKRDKKNAEGVVGDYLSQLPAVRGVYDVADIAQTAIKEGRYTQKDLEKFLKMFPVQNAIPIMILRDEIVARSGLPRK